MKNLFLLRIVIFCLTIFVAVPGFAQSSKVFTLKDGSIIQGQLIGFQKGTYTIQSQNLGQLNLKEDDVVSVANLGAVPSGQKMPTSQQPLLPGLSFSPEIQGQMQMLQSQLFSNPDLIGEMQKMSEDPELMKLISDPNLMQELQTGLMNNDPQGIANNAKVQQILNNPHMQSLMKSLQGQVPPQ